MRFLFWEMNFFFFKGKDEDQWKEKRGKITIRERGQLGAKRLQTEDFKKRRKIGHRGGLFSSRQQLSDLVGPTH